MNIQQRFANTIAFVLAGFVTLAMLGSVDRLATEEHAAVQMARAASSPADLAMAKPATAKRS